MNIFYEVEEKIVIEYWLYKIGRTIPSILVESFDT